MFFIKATSGRNHPLYYLLTFLVVLIFLGGIGNVPRLLVMEHYIVKNKALPEDVAKVQSEMDFSAIGMSNNLGFFLMVLTFVLTTLAFMLCIKHFHRLPFKRLITPLKSIKYKKILFAFGAWMGLAFLAEGFNHFVLGEPYQLTFDPSTFFVTLLIALTLLPIQSTFEELFFRGYIMTGLGRSFGNKWLPLLISSAIFTLFHMMNPEVTQYGYLPMILYYFTAAAFLGYITIMDNSLELAIGIHAATNIFGATFFTYEGAVLPTTTVFTSGKLNPYVLLVFFIVCSIIFIVICRKMYQWPKHNVLTEQIKFDTFEPQV